MAEPTPMAYARSGGTDIMVGMEIRYGKDACVQIEFPPEVEVADLTAVPGEPLDDPVAAVAAAVADPLEFPPLVAATVPGDHVVITVEAGIPQCESVVAGIVHTLLDRDNPLGGITILTAGPFDPTGSLPLPIRQEITVVEHDPAHTESLSYLAAAKDGKPIYLNRLICDADVVIPVGCMRLESSLGYHGIHAGVFPTFSDTATIGRFRAPSSVEWDALQRRRCDETDEAAWLLGVQFTVQVIPGPGDSVLHVLAGDAAQVRRRGQQLCAAAWARHVPHRADLVVAAIEGGPDHQTWDQFARALFSACRVVNTDGTIVICSDMKCPPGPALRRLAASEMADGAESMIKRERSDDALSASLLFEARDRAHVLLLSGLSIDEVEDLGLGHVARPEELGRLGQQVRSCILLANADRAIATAATD